MSSLLDSFNKFALKISSNTIILSLREGYIALIPFFIVASLITLTNQWFKISNTSEQYQYLSNFNSLVWALFPLFTLISFSFHLAKNLKLHTIAAPILVLTCFTVATGYMQVVDNNIKINSKTGVLYSILMPIFCCYLFKFLEQIKSLKLVQASSISIFLRKHLNLIFPYFIVTIATLVLFPYFDSVSKWSFEWILRGLSESSNSIKITVQLLSTHLFWFFGVHGDNTFGILAPQDMGYYYVLPQLDNYNFFSIFVILGGTGCVWGLILAILFIKDAAHEKHIAKISAPFAIFNISEIMIYALPIVFNPYILIPFLICPIINALISFSLLHAGLIPIVSESSIPWFTPIFINSWMLSESIFVVLFQLFIVILNALIYYPFLQLHKRYNLTGKEVDIMVNKYSAGNNIEYQSEGGFAIKHSINQMHKHSLKSVTEMLNQGALCLYYQPKINPKTQSIEGFEALLRLIKNDGTVVGPWFLQTLSKNKLLHVIDNFVIDQLEVDLENFKKLGLHPKISFNIDPENLLTGGYRRVIKAFSQFPEQVEVEILESSYIEDFEKTMEVVTELKANNISCAMDDFGTGYSCLTILSKLNIDTIKLDRSLLPQNNNHKSLQLYVKLAEICHELGFKVVAEGVENTHEENAVKMAKINLVQGFKYYKAIPFKEALELFKNH